MAVACEVSLDGSLKLTTPVSAPVGCTVRVSNLFANFPVRKAALEKTATKYLSQIRPLLLSYYLTHPKVRFQFKCVAGPHANQGKKKIDTKYDFIFAASSTKEQAIVKVFGAEPCRHGRWVDHTSEGDEIKVTAFVANPDANAMPISKKGICIAYKDRPLSVTRNRGLAYSIYSMYKKQIKKAFAAKSTESPSEPFLYLNITSSVGKVDVNIEPAKDDILFESNDKVLNYIKDLFEGVYVGNQDKHTGHSNGRERIQISQNSSSNVRVGECDFSSEITDGSLVPSETTVRQTPERGAETPAIIENTRHAASSPHVTVSSSAVSAGTEPLGANNVGGSGDVIPITRGDYQDSQEQYFSKPEENEETITSPSSQERDPNGSEWNFNMFGTGIEDDDDDFVDIEDVLNDSQARKTEIEEDTRADKTISNPWTISKMNSRVTQSGIRTPRPQTLPIERPSRINTPYSPQQNLLRSTSKAPRTIYPQDTTTTSNVPIVQTPGSRAPVARMSESNGPYYPSFGSDSSLSSPVRPQGHSTPRKVSNAEDTPPTSLQSQNRTRLVTSQKPSRRVTGPMDGWISSNRNDQNSEPDSTSDDEGYIPPPSVFFGKPDLQMSSAPGDGGRGLFHSAADRVRRQRRSLDINANEEDEDISSSDDDDIPIPSISRGREKDQPKLIPKTAQSVNRNKLSPPYSSDFSKAPSKTLSQKSKVSNNYMKKADIFRPSKCVVLKAPMVDLKSLYFRAQLVEDGFYEDPTSGPAPVSPQELKVTFLKFLQNHISNNSYPGNKELETVRKNILDGKNVDVKFRNIVDA
ncbi:hypothetical protein TWF694_008608 [Orbilia ellipsospora]